MKIAFRVDASKQMGTGHVMRCLTLADAMTALGSCCRFISRQHDGNLIDAVRRRGYEVMSLPPPPSDLAPQSGVTAHAAWLGEDWQNDATQTRAALAAFSPDWLVVDHYALDALWEAELRPYCRKLMVIDDLADRKHDSDLLLDQNFGREPVDYESWVHPSCVVLCGSEFALLRSEFAALRKYSLGQREHPQVKHLLITMGGVDKDNATGCVLAALKGSSLAPESRITVVMGATAPWLGCVRQQAAKLNWSCEVNVNVADMARLMADSDLAIGAGGTTSWERCCLGLPALLLVLAENQRLIVRSLGEIGAAMPILGSRAQWGSEIGVKLNTIIGDASILRRMSASSAAIVDGNGTKRVVASMLGLMSPPQEGRAN